MRLITLITALALASCSGKKDEPAKKKGPAGGPADAAIRPATAPTPLFPALQISVAGSMALRLYPDGRVLLGAQTVGVLRDDLLLKKADGSVLAQLSRTEGIRVPAWKHQVAVSERGEITRPGQPALQFEDDGVLRPRAPRSPQVTVSGATSTDDRRIAAFLAALTLIPPSKGAAWAVIPAATLSAQLTLPPLFRIVPARAKSSASKDPRTAWSTLIARDDRCTNKIGSSKGHRLTIELDQPSAVDDLVISIGPTEEDEPELLEGYSYPNRISVIVDGAKPVTLENELAGFELDLKGKSVKKIEIVTTAMSSTKGKTGCITAVSLGGRGTPYNLVDIRAAHIDKLVKDLPALIAGANTCDDAVLDAWIRYPFVWQVSRDHDNPARARRFANTTDLLEMCNRGEGDAKGLGNQVTFTGAAMHTEAAGTRHGVSIAQRIGTMSWKFELQKNRWWLTRMASRDLKK